MFAISYLLAYIFNIAMRMRHTIVPVCVPPNHIRVFYSGSNYSIDPVSYIVCLHGRVPERYELWGLNTQAVCEVHQFAQIRILDDFRADTF